MGADDNHPVGPSNPIPVYRRGLYFMGEQYARIEATTEAASPPVFAPTHNQLFWIRFYEFNTAKTCIFKKGDFMQLCITAPDNYIELEYLMETFELNDDRQETFSATV